MGIYKSNKGARNMKKEQCDETKCLEENTGLINGDWLCLDCGEKVKPPVEENHES